MFGARFVLSRTARYVVHMLKLRCHYASLDKFYNLNMWIVSALLYLKVRAIFAMQPVHVYGEKFVFNINAWYVVHMLKLQCHYTSFGKFYNLNLWIFLASLYLKEIFAIWLVELYAWGEICFHAV